MNPGETFFWGVVGLVLLLAALACVDVYRVSRRPPGGRFVGEDEARRIEDEAA